MPRVLIVNNSARRKIVLASGMAAVLDNNTEQPVRWPKRPNISHRQEGQRAAKRLTAELIREIAEACAADAEPLSDARVGLVPKANHQLTGTTSDAQIIAG